MGFFSITYRAGIKNRFYPEGSGKRGAGRGASRGCGDGMIAWRRAFVRYPAVSWFLGQDFFFIAVLYFFLSKKAPGEKGGKRWRMGAWKG